jgi:small-conductance mechanosensitive channel
MRTLAASCLVLASWAVVAAQPQAPAPDAVASAIAAVPSAEPFTFTFFNRPIVMLRARVLGRSPVERAIGARRALDDLIAQRLTGPVQSRSFEGGTLISVGDRTVLALTDADIDDLSGETMSGVVTQVIARLQQALDEAAEARAPAVLLRAAAGALAALGLGVLALWGVTRVRQAAAGRLEAVAERTVVASGLADAAGLRASRLLDFERGALTTIAVVADLVVIYTCLTFILRRFPYTRPWGESMRGFLTATVENLSLGVLGAVPGLFTAFLILLLTRFFVRLVGFWFNAVEAGRVSVRWFYPETAQPTRRLLTTLLWLFAVVVAYPYLPGSQTDAFKGVSVFLGLIVTFGSSGLVNQIMSGFMITYSRALRAGDFVRIGDVDGTVIHLGILSTKLKTLKNEEVTIPNAVVVSQTTTDYTRLGETEGVFTPTSVTIGYDAPWRQVHALLLLAAERTPGIRMAPMPVVIQSGLEDFYVKYTLLVCLERQQSRLVTLDALHANIQDLFNEYGVQIMSPNYVADPAAPKLVAKRDWFAAPTRSVPPETRP